MDGVYGAMTTGRVGFAETYKCLLDTIYQTRLATNYKIGLDWTQEIQNCAELCVSHDDCKYVLFIDGDGVFDINDLYKMYEIIEADETLDAIFPVQAERHAERPLVWNYMAEHFGNMDYSGELTDVLHGHHGLTFIRRRVFDQMPKPWFCSVPGRSGRWDVKDGMKSPDTYFWFKFREHGFRVAQANRIVLGHMELCINWQDGPRVIKQSTRDYKENGRPKGLRGAPTVGEMAL